MEPAVAPDKDNVVEAPVQIGFVEAEDVPPFVAQHVQDAAHPAATVPPSECH